jgi:hypothetical protein
MTYLRNSRDVADRESHLLYRKLKTQKQDWDVIRGFGGLTGVWMRIPVIVQGNVICCGIFSTASNLNHSFKVPVPDSGGSTHARALEYAIPSPGAVLSDTSACF